MTCPECGGDRVTFRIPEDVRGHLPDDPEFAAICTRCLTVEPAEDAPDDAPDFGAVSDAVPAGEAGVAMALAVGLLDSLALHREDVAALLERAERAGADPLLVLDRLAADPGLDPAIDLDRRLTQVEQLLYG